MTNKGEAGMSGREVPHLTSSVLAPFVAMPLFLVASCSVRSDARSPERSVLAASSDALCFQKGDI